MFYTISALHNQHGNVTPCQRVLIYEGSSAFLLYVSQCVSGSYLSLFFQ